ncbi:MAG: tryptophan synthase subunit alpha [Rhodospirillaceae bacterium]|nr:tryptophan synthase subunit alpha [Rhodospirillaceae bacterium]
MTDRLGARFAALAAQHRCGLAAFVTAGEPAPEAATALWHALAGAGADILEVGLPADAWLDGPAIQAAHRRAKARGIDAAATLADVARFRSRDDATPIVLMGYGETLRDYGTEALARDAAAAGADAMLFIAAAPAELAALDAATEKHGVALIRVAFGEDEAAWRKATDGARGFIYVPAAAGGTGIATPAPDLVARRLARIRALTPLPLLAGFGVRTPEMFRALAPHADALAVGTAFAQIIADHLDAAGAPLASLAGAVSDLARALAASGSRSTARGLLDEDLSQP